jgi:hypothetical protein
MSGDWFILSLSFSLLASLYLTCLSGLLLKTSTDAVLSKKRRSEQREQSKERRKLKKDAEVSFVY